MVGRWCFYFFCFFTFIPVPLSSLSLSFISSAISSVSFLPFSGRRHKMTHKGWRVVKPQHNQSIDENILWVLIRSTHNICFHQEIRKLSILLSWKTTSTFIGAMWMSGKQDRPWSSLGRSILVQMSNSVFWKKSEKNQLVVCWIWQ